MLNGRWEKFGAIRVSDRSRMRELAWLLWSMNMFGTEHATHWLESHQDLDWERHGSFHGALPNVGVALNRDSTALGHSAKEHLSLAAS